MKKLILNLLLIFCTVFSYAQNTKYFEAIYNIYYNTDVPQTRKGQLLIDLTDTRSIFNIGKSNIEKSNSSIEKSDYGLTYNIKYKDIERFIEVDFNSQNIFSKETHRGNVYYVKDTIYDFNWNLSYSEQKKIGTLSCKKATTYYRGRNYTAWYTIDIPLGYGPYKFNGLPGLIVSISDDKRTFAWILSSYKTTTQKPQFKNNEKLKPRLNAKEYYSKIRYPSNSEQQSIFQSKLPKGIKLISVTSDAHIRKGIEIKFEWEEETKKE